MNPSQAMLNEILRLEWALCDTLCTPWSWCAIKDLAKETRAHEIRGNRDARGTPKTRPVALHVFWISGARLFHSLFVSLIEVSDYSLSRVCRLTLKMSISIRIFKVMVKRNGLCFDISIAYVPGILQTYCDSIWNGISLSQVRKKNCEFAVNLCPQSIHQLPAFSLRQSSFLFFFLELENGLVTTLQTSGNFYLVVICIFCYFLTSLRHKLFPMLRLARCRWIAHGPFVIPLLISWLAIY